MKQRVNVITLGVSDLGRARRFYEALGWTTRAGANDDVVFFPGREMVVSLWGGYSSVIVDPDGHPWEVAHNPHWTITDEGGLRLSGS